MIKTIKICSLAIMIALCTVSFSSCSGDDKPDNSIVGTWRYLSASADIAHPDPIKVEEEEEEYADIIAALSLVTITIKADNTFTVNALIYSTNGTWVQDGNNFLLTVTPESDLGFIEISGLAVLQNGILTFTQDMLDQIYNDYPEEETYRDAGFTRYTVTLKLRK